MYLMQHLISFNFYNKILFWESNVLQMFTCVFLLTYIVLTWVHMYIYICSICVYIYICKYYIYYMYICISDHKLSTANRVLKSHKSKMSVICMKSWKQCALPVVTTMPWWELMHLGMSTSFTKCMSCHKVIVVITGRARYLHECIYI